jgi:hypothetical protein
MQLFDYLLIADVCIAPLRKNTQWKLSLGPGTPLTKDLPRTGTRSHNKMPTAAASYITRNVNFNVRITVKTKM